MTRTSTGHWLLALCALLAVLLLAGCTETRTDSTTDRQAKEVTKKVGKIVTKEIVVQTPLENGGLHVERMLVTDEVEDTGTDITSKSGSQELMRSGLDDTGKGLSLIHI